LEHGITVYPAREERGRWRAVWHEDGERQQCEAASEERLATNLEKVTERLGADAPFRHVVAVPASGVRVVEAAWIPACSRLHSGEASFTLRQDGGNSASRHMAHGT
jgi:hypothetical protein